MRIETRFNSDTKLVLTPVDSKEKQILALALTGNRCVKIEASGDGWVLTLVPPMMREDTILPSVDEPQLQLFGETS